MKTPFLKPVYRDFRLTTRSAASQQGNGIGRITADFKDLLERQLIGQSNKRLDAKWPESTQNGQLIGFMQPESDA